MLKDKVAVVTGGASGIGAALCRKFASEGARIACIDMDAVGARRITDELTGAGIDARGYSLDITDEKDCQDTFKKILEDFGGIDILCNNAGITQRSAFRETSLDVYRRVMEVNFFGAVTCTRAAIESVIERKGTIVVTSSIAGIGPLLGRTGYSASKHALHGFFESLRTELFPLGVTILMVCPGFTRTNLQQRALDSDGTITTHPRSQMGSEDTPERVAAAVFRAVMKKKRILVLTPNGKMAYLMHRLFPGVYEKIITRKFREELERS